MMGKDKQIMRKPIMRNYAEMVEADKRRMKKPPETDASNTLRGAALGLLAIGVLSGGAVIYNSFPSRSQEWTPLNWLVLAVGATQILGSLATAALFYVIPEIGDAVRAIWTKGTTEV
jgi:hypothetical protein